MISWASDPSINLDTEVTQARHWLLIVFNKSWRFIEIEKQVLTAVALLLVTHRKGILILQRGEYVVLVE